MISILYSLLESFEGSPNIIVTMILSVFTWTSGLFSAIPDYAVYDFYLAVLTLFHLYVAISFITVADASYKKTLLKLHRRIAKPFYDVPMLMETITTGGIIMSVLLAWRACNNPGDSTATLRAVVSMYTTVCSLFLQKLSITLIKLGVDHVMKQEQEVEKHDIRSWKTPPKWTGSFLTAPVNWILRPQVVGADNIPTDKGSLYVMNHATLGMEMAPFVSAIYNLKNVFLRGLADNFHFGTLNGEFIRYFGGVNGTRDNVDVLMENNDNILVYPGGGHEILKPCAVPNYTLMWKQRLGFARMAIKHGYPIMPCASVGTEDMMDRKFDISLEYLRKDLKCPVPVTLPHKLQRVYFWVGEPIPTAHYNGDWKNDKFAREVRDKAKAAVEAGIKELQERQANDPNRFLLNHMINGMKTFCLDPFGTSNPVVKQIEQATKERAPIPASKKAA